MRRIALVAAFAALMGVVFAAPAEARPAPSGTTITVVDTTGTLPAAEAAVAWSKNTDVRLVVAAACSVGECFTIQWDDSSTCSGYQTGIIAIGGCAGGNPCQAYVTRGIPDYTLLRVVTHELGHCLGLSHNTTDRRSIMQPAPVVDQPNAGDRAAVRAIW